MLKQLLLYPKFIMTPLDPFCLWLVDSMVASLLPPGLQRWQLVDPPCNRDLHPGHVSSRRLASPWHMAQIRSPGSVVLTATITLIFCWSQNWNPPRLLAKVAPDADKCLHTRGEQPELLCAGRLQHAEGDPSTLCFVPTARPYTVRRLFLDQYESSHSSEQTSYVWRLWGTACHAYWIWEISDRQITDEAPPSPPDIQIWNISNKCNW